MRLPAPSGLIRKKQNATPGRTARSVLPGVIDWKKRSRTKKNVSSGSKNAKPVTGKNQRRASRKPFPRFSCGKGFSVPGVPFYVLFGERFFLPFLYALRSMESLSAIMAMNSPLVGLSSGVHTLHPKAVFRVSTRPRFHATSMAWRMARSTLLADVPK